MERSLDIRTGESIAVHFELAGLGSRFLAVAIDLALQVTIAIAVMLVALGLHAPLAIVAGQANLSKTATALTIGLVSFALFALFFGYFIAFEFGWHGRTPGKRALGLRVVRDGGFPIDFGAAVIRNLIRVLEVALGFYAISAIVSLLSHENKRIGDFAAGTVVVRDRSNDPVALADLGTVAPERDDGVSAANRDLIARFLRRRATLEAPARSTLAARIAARVRPHLQASFAHLDDESLLEHLGRPD